MFDIVKYTDKYQERWDQFVLGRSMNGTFLQTRNFLNYHPEGRFRDASILILQGSTIVAVIPACDIMEEEKRCFFSHPGSTFGGIVIANDKYNISTMEELFPCVEDYLKEEKYGQAIMKGTSDIFSSKPNDLLDYYFYKNGWNVHDELSFYINCKTLPDDIVSGFTASKRRDYRYSLKNELGFRKLEEDSQIEDFYRILCNNLKKYGVLPVHTLNELLEFKHERLIHDVDFYGVYWENKLIAGSMVFYFDQKVLHTQYLAADDKYSDLYPMNFLDYHLIRTAKENGFEMFSFGISTENHGKILNKSLAQFKEGFGCDYCVNKTYVKG